MRCEACQGTGWIRRRSGPYGRRLTVSAPCQFCGGSGIVHCCEGECAQPEPPRHVLLALILAVVIALPLIINAALAAEPAKKADLDDALHAAQAQMLQAEGRYYLELARHFERLNAQQAAEAAAKDRYWHDYVAGLKPPTDAPTSQAMPPGAMAPKAEHKKGSAK